MEPFVNKYPNGLLECFYGESSIKLFPDGHITFNFWDDELPSFSFDLLSEVGEYWKPEILVLLECFEIELEIIDTESEYCNKWISHNITPYKENK